MPNSLELTKRRTGGTSIRPLGIYYADVLERQAMRRNVAYQVQYFSMSDIGFADFGTESPPNVAFLLEREVNKLHTFESLSENWDLHGASAIKPAAIQSAIELLRHAAFVQLLPYQNPRLAAFPLRNGGIQLDLNGGKAPLEVEIFPDGSQEFTLFGPDDEVVWEENNLILAVERYQDFSPVLLGVA
jgi:hypothetical protein